MVSRTINSFGARERFERYLATHGVRRSSSRDAVFAILLACGDHLEISELIRRAKKRRIGEATVYRALKLFQEAGLVSRVEGKDGQVSYEIGGEHHDHMVCSRCGAMIEFHSETIERIQRELARSHGFSIQSHRHEIYGICRNCREPRPG